MNMTSDPSLQESCMAALRHMGVEVRALINKTNELEAENDKLRELVRDMWHEGAFGPGACYVKAAGRLEERTRELGIEVDE